MKHWLRSTFHQELQKARDGWEQQQIEYERKLSEYYNLIHAVESKFDGETRYQTALRYIQQAEQRPFEAYQSELDKPTEINIELPDVSNTGGKAKPRIHMAPGDSSCISCEG